MQLSVVPHSKFAKTTYPPLLCGFLDLTAIGNFTPALGFCQEVQVEQEIDQETVQETVQEIVQEIDQETVQEKVETKGYQFTPVKIIQCTKVKNQDNTGTCWSFATTSFLEAEMIRLGRSELNLSEMFIVKNIYREKAMNYVLRQGKANFGEGALAHDYINAVSRYGVVPESVFSGKSDDQKQHDHAEMTSLLQSLLEGVVKIKKPTQRWKAAYSDILDSYLGTASDEFEYAGKSYTAKSFAKSIDFDPSDYVNITSYTHHPFYEKFVLEIPDNFSNGSYLNLPIDDVVAIIDNAVENGYSVAWDGDVSERSFGAAQGIAVLPASPGRRDLFRKPGKELTATQEMRQATFESYETTDDHLMHLTGIATDQNGTKYYMIKNSWGAVGPFNGFIHMSEAYVRLKTVAILVHKDALPARLRKD